MKKLLFAGLMIALLLAGCAVYDADDTSVLTTQPSTQETVPGTYVQESQIEKQTNGAIRLYAPDVTKAHWLAVLGGNVLIASGEENTELTMLTGMDAVATSVMLDADISQGCYQLLDSGLAYYIPQKKQAVFLNPQLQETYRVQLPETTLGNPVFAPDGSEVYYCQEQQICAFDVKNNISRPVKSHGCKDQTLLGCYFDGTQVACRVTYETGKTTTLYIATQTGQTLATDSGADQLITYENSYYVCRMDGTVRQRIFGTLDATPLQFNSTQDPVPALELNGAIVWSEDENKIHTERFIDLSTGMQTAAVTLSGYGEPRAMVADKWNQCVWILTTDTESERPALLRWDIKATPVEDETVYTGQLYTAATPDEEGLTLRREGRVADMRKAYGVRVRIWDLAVRSPGTHDLQAEYQTEAIDRCLDELEPVLAEFPEKFLDKTTVSQIRVCIVRTVDEEVKAVQYWDDGDAYIALSVGVDVRAEFIKALSKIVDSRVLGRSSKYDSWRDLNPAGFVYGDEATYDEKYLEGESRAFVSKDAMATPTEDRSAMFFQAMQPNNGEIFQSETMQKKLQMVCSGIRDAWRLKNSTEAFPWEQYLSEPIAAAEK